MCAALLSAALPALADDVLRVGSKRFTESYILAEVVTQTAAPHARTEHRQGLGNTAIVLEALKNGSIDVYPEYVGTIDQEVLKHDKPASLEQIRRELAPMGLGVAIPLGFNNTYALAVRSDTAGVRTLSDLARQPGLRFGLSHEFIGRADGWAGLRQRYGLLQEPRGLDHGIAYEALAQRQVDVIDIYSTDAKIGRYKLTVLEDDKHYFPRYDAVLLYRLDAARRFPAAWAALQKLEGRISATDMIAMNGAAELQGQPFAGIAKNWLMSHPAEPVSTLGSSRGRPVPDMDTGSSASALPPRVNTGSAAPKFTDVLFASDLGRLTGQHVLLVALSVLLACVVGVPLGIVAACQTRLRQSVLGLAGMLQTIPSLALLAILIPLLGRIGIVPALVALFVYALLPIVRNTCTGLAGVPRGLQQAGLALGLNRWQRLWHVELPLALPVILAGVKTAAVMSVGTATIAAFIGAGGYGERITTGLALNDNNMMLAGAIPAAVLALLTQALFELAERRFVVQQVRH
ncbi:glycine betaine ABC transporter substrate-binding protein [Pseudoduganella plicata]|uniref:ABC transporter permease subunit n=1 Tax=Pseudoduganella plicata TaxID=321984 RepID=A0ABX5SIU7_9BURK|nr:glycine betaine ABC transporter substrate-binding protein [Pseudoduganella plicata]QBQ39403.1 ABC transporter permease subunit [Pseudoduganella plicata]